MNPRFTSQIDTYRLGELPKPIAAPDDTTFTYARKVVLEVWQAGRRNEKVEDEELDRAARNLAEQMRKLHNMNSV